jgi:tetratricopeptide (TPR) repeat protein
VLQALRRYREAISCYDRVITLDPGNAEVWPQKGSSLQALGRHTEALACYDHALAVDSGNAEAWSHKGSSLQALGRHAEALASYNHAFTLDPYVVSGKFRRWAVRALLRCQRLIKTAGKSADQECDQQPCSTV